MSTEDEAIFSKVRDDLVRYATVLVGSNQAEDVVSTVIVRLLSRRAWRHWTIPSPTCFGRY